MKFKFFIFAGTARIFALKQGFYLVKAKEDLYFLNDLIKGLQTKLKFPSQKVYPFFSTTFNQRLIIPYFTGYFK